MWYGYNKSWGAGTISVEYVGKERNIEFLLKKYETKQPGEPNGVLGDTKKEWRLKQRLRYADYVLGELNMKGVQKDQVYHLLKTISYLKKLCKNCKYEKIITVICFYIKFCTTPTVKLTHYNRYKVCRKHKLTLEMYSTIVSNLAHHFQSNTPLSPLSHVI